MTSSQTLLGLERAALKDLIAILRQKEQDLTRVRKEILALLSVIPLLTDDADRVVDDVPKHEIDGEKGRF